MRAVLTLILTALVAALAVAQEGKVYKWQTEEGTVYSEEPPPEATGQAQEIQLEERPISVIGTDNQSKWLDADGNVRYGPKPPEGAVIPPQEEQPVVEIEQIEQAPQQPAAEPGLRPVQPTVPELETDMDYNSMLEEGVLDTTISEETAETVEKEKIYTWTDEEGRTHMSTDPPPADFDPNKVKLISR